MSDLPSKRLRQADIASRAGVSISTVSRVLANEPGISASVRRQILAVAAELGYPLKPAAAPFAALALIASDSATGGLSVFYEGVVEGLRLEAAERGVPFAVRLLREARMRPDTVAQHLADTGADSLFLVGIDPSPALREWQRATGTPMVLVNGTDPLLQFDGVSPANFFGAFLAADRLIAAGHRRILHVTGAHRQTIRERVRGFEAALAAAGAEGRLVPLSFHGDAGREAHAATEAVLAEDPGFTAAFCMNDVIAVGVLDAAIEAGRRVPDDFAIVGFDDLPCAAMTDPRLATMRVDRVALGREAIRLMEARRGDPAAPARQVCHGVVPVPGGSLPHNL